MLLGVAGLKIRAQLVSLPLLFGGGGWCLVSGPGLAGLLVAVS